MEKILKSLKFPASLIDEIEKYREENHISTFSSTVFELIRLGLHSQKN